ncbi:MAG: glutathione S-transferase family protein [Sandarakinorhabdus sp.]|nr:glutathione S-transferase family protein [Sandarakinorhabdus sp.]
MKLYDMQKAPNPRRVRIFLAEKGVDIPKEQVDIQAGENLAADYLSINPRGVVPTLVLDDGRVLDESVAICRLIEGLHPEPNLFGASPWESADVERWQRRMEFDGLFNIAAVFRNTAPAYAERGAAGAGPPTPAIPAMAERGRLLARQWMDRMDDRLAGRDFVAADRFTIADITAFVALEFARWVGMRAEETHPNVAAYRARIKARPSSSA